MRLLVVMSLVVGLLALYWLTCSLEPPHKSVSIIEAMGGSSTRRRRRNIYGKPLVTCRRKGTRANRAGSWDADGLCSEMDGGVHQICMKVDDRTKQFSEDTHQGGWSHTRIGNNHCMCLGAWALFKARQLAGETPATTDELVCGAIPETALSPSYVGEWSTWRGKQMDDQIKAGVEALYNQCSAAAATPGEKAHLDTLYSSLLTHIG